MPRTDEHPLPCRDTARSESTFRARRTNLAHSLFAPEFSTSCSRVVRPRQAVPLERSPGSTMFRAPYSWTRASGQVCPSGSASRTLGQPPQAPAGSAGHARTKHVQLDKRGLRPAFASSRIGRQRRSRTLTSTRTRSKRARSASAFRSFSSGSSRASVSERAKTSAVAATARKRNGS